MNTKQESYMKEALQKIVYGCPKCHGKDLLCICRYTWLSIPRRIKAGIPLKFVDWSIKNFTYRNDDVNDAIKVLKEYIKNIDEHYKNGEGLYIYGSIGNGKTTFASVILNRAIDKGYTACFITLDKCMAVLRDRKDAAIEDLDQYNRKDIWSDFLVIDEVNSKYSEAPTNSVKSMFDELLRDRINSGLPTIITSNTDITSSKGKSSTFGDKISDLINHSCDILKLEYTFSLRAYQKFEKDVEKAGGIDAWREEKRKKEEKDKLRKEKAAKKKEGEEKADKEKEDKKNKNYVEEEK